MQARLLLLKNVRRYSIERDYGYNRFSVETKPKDAGIGPAKRP